MKTPLVMAFGTFDFFHAGHEDYLRQAKALGESLIVVVARDSTVESVKHREAIHKEKERLQQVQNCPYVDKAVLGLQEDKYRIIKKFRPDFLALGYDQFVFTYGLENFLIKEGMNTKIVRMEPYESKHFKSSIIRASLENS